MTKIYSIYDEKAQAYNHPIYFRTRGEAIRSWTDTIEDKSTLFNKHPEDYTMYELGEYDEFTGEIKLHKEKIHCGKANDYKGKQQ